MATGVAPPMAASALPRNGHRRQLSGAKRAGPAAPDEGSRRHDNPLRGGRTHTQLSWSDGEAGGSSAKGPGRVLGAAIGRAQRKRSLRNASAPRWPPWARKSMLDCSGGKAEQPRQRRRVSPQPSFISTLIGDASPVTHTHTHSGRMWCPRCSPSPRLTMHLKVRVKEGRRSCQTALHQEGHAGSAISVSGPISTHQGPPPCFQPAKERCGWVSPTAVRSESRTSGTSASITCNNRPDRRASGGCHTNILGRETQRELGDMDNRTSRQSGTQRKLVGGCRHRILGRNRPPQHFAQQPWP